MKMSEQINELAKALAEFQGEVKQPEKTGVNPHFKSKFVTLDDTVKAIHSVAPKKGLSFIQMPVTTEQGVGVITTIFHSSGQYLEFEPFILPLEKKTAQSAGSSITYSKRYSLAAAFGLVSDEDDDGNEATANGAQPITQKQVGDLKVKVLEFAKLCEKAPADVYEALKLKEANIAKLSMKEADFLINKVDGWTKTKQSESA